MKSIFRTLFNAQQSYVHNILVDFRWYRRKFKGTWYKVYDPNSDLGMAGYSARWTQERPMDDGVEIIAEESYLR